MSDVDEVTVKSTTSVQSDSRKRKADMDMDAKDSGSQHQPVSLDSDDDELLVMPRRASGGSQSNMSQSSMGSSSSTKPSLLDMMATPRGTQQLPRSTDRTGQGYNMPRPGSRPALERFSSQVSDDGFTSNSSLENRLQGRGFSREPEILLPLSQQSSGSGYKRIETLDQQHDKRHQQLQSQLTQQQHQIQQQKQQPPTPYSSLHTKVQSYSQKRSGDFANYSSAEHKPRRLPSSITGHNPVPVSHNTTLASLAGSPSLANVRNPQSRSSSPALSSSSTKLANGPKRTDQKRITKDGILLSDEQQHVLDEVILRNKNVFFTGSAGTGKSVLLRELIAQLRQKYAPKNSKNDYWESSNDSVAVTASTGIAACNIGGCTLHSFAGVGLGQEAVPVLISRVRKNSNSVRRWQDTKVLIIDEVSMIDADFMDKLETVARAVRKNESPWGGIQVVLTGDFFQLPPVNKSGNVKFSFEAESWGRTITTTIQLMQVFRQKDQSKCDQISCLLAGSCYNTYVIFSIHTA